MAESGEPVAMNSIPLVPLQPSAPPTPPVRTNSTKESDTDYCEYLKLTKDAGMSARDLVQEGAHRYQRAKHNKKIFTEYWASCVSWSVHSQRLEEDGPPARS